MDETFECLGFHKSGKIDAERAIQIQAFHISVDKPGKEQWLGNGVYFWIEYGDAVWWPGGYDNPVIVLADIKCQIEKFLDLDDHQGFFSFCDEMKSAFEQFRKSGLDIELGSQHVIGGASCNYYKFKNGIDLIKYSFFDRRSGRPQLCATGNYILKNIRKATDFSQIVTGYL